jgi:hypothetical protein
VQRLQELGWTAGRNVQIDIRWDVRNLERARKAATELLALAPDVILVNGSNPVVALQQATTRTVFRRRVVCC